MLTPDEVLLTGLYGVALYGAYLRATLRLHADSDSLSLLPLLHTHCWPRATLTRRLLVAIPTSLQFALPALLDLFRSISP